jgi:hypothetical protein
VKQVCGKWLPLATLFRVIQRCFTLGQAAKADLKQQGILVAARNLMCAPNFGEKGDLGRFSM